jgi:hypothetical protein
MYRIFVLFFVLVKYIPMLKSLENATSSRPLLIKRARGIEPRSLAWKAKVLPLNYARVGVNFNRTSTRLAYSAKKTSQKRKFFESRSRYLGTAIEESISRCLNKEIEI